MKRANEDIRTALEKSGVRQWELAEKIGYSASHFSLKMRKEFSSEDKVKAFTAIQDIVDEREV